MKTFNIEQIAQKSMKWLESNYLDELRESLQYGFFAFQQSMDEEFLKEFLQEFGDRLTFNFSEWLIADSILTINNKDIRTVDLLLSPKGPGFTKIEREMLKVLKENRLQLYEITRTDPVRLLLS